MPDSASQFYADLYKTESARFRVRAVDFRRRLCREGSDVSTDHRRRHVFVPAIPESYGCHSYPPAHWSYGIPSDRERHRRAYL
jgi:hypothetical protein